jgi:hypothetical protein
MKEKLNILQTLINILQTLKRILIDPDMNGNKYIVELDEIVPSSGEEERLIDELKQDTKARETRNAFRKGLGKKYSSKLNQQPREEESKQKEVKKGKEKDDEGR